jgi:hypothetical protein
MKPGDVQFTATELETIARLVQNLYASAVEAELEVPGVLESIYYKTQEFLDQPLDNGDFVW